MRDQREAQNATNLFYPLKIIFQVVNYCGGDTIHTISDIEDETGLGYKSIRSRLHSLDDRFEGVIKRGKQNKILVTDNGLTLFRRLRELEDEQTVEAALETMEDEMGKDSPEEEDEDIKRSGPSEDYVRKLEEENEFLRNQIKQKDRQIEQLLPRSESGDEPPDSLWGKFKHWWRSPM